MLKRCALIVVMMLTVPLVPTYAYEVGSNGLRCAPVLSGCVYTGCGIGSTTGTEWYIYNASEINARNCALCDQIAELLKVGYGYPGIGRCHSTPLSANANTCASNICGVNVEWCDYYATGVCPSGGGGPVCESGNQTPTIHNDGAQDGDGDNTTAAAIKTSEPVLVDITVRHRRWGIQLMRMGPGIGTPVFSFPAEEAAPDEGWFVAVPESQTDPRTGKPYLRTSWPSHVNQVAVLLHALSGETVERLAPARYHEPPFTSLDPGARRRQVDFLRAGAWTATRRHVITLKMGDRPNAVMFAGSYTLLLKDGAPATWDDLLRARDAGKLTIRVME